MTHDGFRLTSYLLFITNLRTDILRCRNEFFAIFFRKNGKNLFVRLIIRNVTYACRTLRVNSMRDNEICGTPLCANIKYEWLQIRMADGNIRGEKSLFSLTTARGSYEWRASWKSLSGCSRPASLNETPFCGWISLSCSCGPLQPEWKLPMTRFNCDLFLWKRSIFLTLFIYLFIISFFSSFVFRCIDILKIWYPCLFKMC